MHGHQICKDINILPGTTTALLDNIQHLVIRQFKRNFSYTIYPEGFFLGAHALNYKELINIQIISAKRSTNYNILINHASK